jgi:adenylate kinase
MYLVLLGPPGAGKGTQARRLSEELGLPQISSGDLFRENLKNRTALGKAAQEYLDLGLLVPDDITIGMVTERLAQEDAAQGAILDGFPRTPAQAEALGQWLKGRGAQIDAVANLLVTEPVLIQRLSGRRTCRAKGHIYHLDNRPPRQDLVCDIDGSELYQRDDDRPETVKKRIQVYREETAPLVEYYSGQTSVIDVDGEKSPDLVTQALKAWLEQAIG